MAFTHTFIAETKSDYRGCHNAHHHAGVLYAALPDIDLTVVHIYRSDNLGVTWTILTTHPRAGEFNKCDYYIKSSGIHALTYGYGGPAAWHYVTFDGANWSSPEIWYAAVRTFGGMVPDLEDEEPHINFGRRWGGKYITRKGGSWGAVENTSPGVQGAGGGPSIAMRPNNEPTLSAYNDITPAQHRIYDRTDGVWTVSLEEEPGLLVRRPESERMWLLTSSGVPYRQYESVYYRDGSGTGGWTLDNTFVPADFGKYGTGSNCVGRDILVTSRGEVFMFIDAYSRTNIDNSLFVVKRNTDGSWESPVCIFAGSSLVGRAVTGGGVSAVQNPVGGWGVVWKKYDVPLDRYEWWWSASEDLVIDPDIKPEEKPIWRTVRVADAGRHPRNTGREVRSGINE